MKSITNSTLKVKGMAILLSIGMALSILMLPIQVQAEDSKVIVSTKEEFMTAIAEKNAPVIELANSIDISGNYGDVLDVDNLTIDLSGNCLSAGNFTAIFQGDNFKIMNGQMDAKGGAYALFIGDNRTTENILVENVTMTGGINAFNAQNITLRNVTATGTSYYAVWCDENAYLTIESGVFQTNGVAVLGTAETPTADDIALTIKGGKFNTNQKPLVLEDTHTRRKVIAFGGQYDIDPAKYVGDNYKVYQADNQYLVAPTATGITINRAAANIEVGKTISLSASVEPASSLETIQWMSDHTEVAVVENGVVTAKGIGTATITAKAGNQSDECIVTVYKVAEPIISNEEKTGIVINASAINEVKEAVSAVIADVKAGKEAAAVTFADTEAKAALIHADNIDIQMITQEVDEKAVKSDDLSVIKAKVKEISKEDNMEWQIAQYIDISILLKVNQQRIGNITALDHPITLTIRLRDHLIQKGREYCILRVHNGVAEILEDSEDGAITFQTDTFSTYALIYKDTNGAGNISNDEKIEVAIRTFVDGKEVLDYAGSATKALVPVGKITQETLQQLEALYNDDNYDHTLRGIYFDIDGKEKLQVGDEISSDLKVLYMFVDSKENTEIRATPNTSDRSMVIGFGLAAIFNASILIVYLAKWKKKINMN